MFAVRPLLFAAAVLLVPVMSAQAAETWQAGAKAADDAYWSAYNRTDPDAMNSWLTDDVEFYHDRGGMLIGKKALAAVNDGMKTMPFKLRREAVPGTIHFFPMRKGDDIYAVLVTGEHQFYALEKGKPERRAGRSYFSNLMRLEGNDWRVARIYSYEHVDAAPVKK